MSETKPRFRGPVLGFVSAERPSDLNALNVEQYMSAFLSWTAGQLHDEAPPLEDTTTFLEGLGSGLVHAPTNASALYRCGANDIGTQFKNITFSGDVILFIGSPAFLRQSALVMMAILAPPNVEYIDIWPKFQAEFEWLANQAASLLPGEVCRFGFLYLGTQRFAKAHMMPMIMHHLHHGRQFDGTEAAAATLSPVQALSPTWPNAT
jgi:hypothetical protein